MKLSKNGNEQEKVFAFLNSYTRLVQYLRRSNRYILNEEQKAFAESVKAT